VFSSAITYGASPTKRHLSRSYVFHVYNMT